MTGSLLTPEFAGELDALRRLLRVRARSGSAGAATALRRGRGAEFEEHRAYAQGDDVGRLDWLAFARTGQPVLKQHRAEEDTVFRVLLDASASLGFGTPRKLDVATRVAAAIAYLALTGSDRAQMLTTGAKGVRASPPRRGRASLGPLLRELEDLEPGGRASLAEAVIHALAIAERPGALLVISDFLDDGPVLDALRRARFEGHDVALVQVLSPEELSPIFEGDLALVDAETEALVELTADAATIRAYLERLAALFASLRAFAQSTGSTYARVSTDEPLPRVVRRILARAAD